MPESGLGNLPKELDRGCGCSKAGQGLFWRGKHE